MLPALKPDGLSLADVLESCLSAISGVPNRLLLPPVDRAVVVLVDGLGALALKASVGHARALAGAINSRSVIDSGFPTTTAAALATLTTGRPPGEHGLVGYSVLDPAHDRVVNQLSGWDEHLDPYTWQPLPTVFERAVAGGLGAIAIGPERYRETGFTHAVLRGTEYRGAASIEDRMMLALDALYEPGPPGVIYVYVPELDQAAHSWGWQSRQWTDALEAVDSAMRPLAAIQDDRRGVVVTADHGILDVSARSHILFDTDPRLVDGVRFIAGEPRCLQIHFEPDLSPARVEAVVNRWRESESERSWVGTRAEVVTAGWFGHVKSDVAPRIGDLLVAARKDIAYYDSRAPGNNGQSMIGQHGSWSAAEVRVPLLRFGAFAR